MTGQAEKQLQLLMENPPSTKEAFDVQWEWAAERGYVDGLGGSQYRRELSEWKNEHV